MRSGSSGLPGDAQVSPGTPEAVRLGDWLRWGGQRTANVQAAMWLDPSEREVSAVGMRPGAADNLEGCGCWPWSLERRATSSDVSGWCAARWARGLEPWRALCWPVAARPRGLRLAVGRAHDEYVGVVQTLAQVSVCACACVDGRSVWALRGARVGVLLRVHGFGRPSASVCGCLAQGRAACWWLVAAPRRSRLCCRAAPHASHTPCPGQGTQTSLDLAPSDPGRHPPPVHSLQSGADGHGSARLSGQRARLLVNRLRAH